MDTTQESRPNCAIGKYSILELHTSVVGDAEADAFSIRPDLRIEEGKPQYKVLVECRCKKDGFSFASAMEGDFTFREPITRDNLVWAWVNGCTILYGIMRGLYVSLSAQSLGKPLMLPTVMMIDEVKAQLERMKQSVAKVEDKTESSGDNRAADEASVK